MTMLNRQEHDPTEQDLAADDDPQPTPDGAAPAAGDDSQEVLIDNVAAETEEDPTPADDPDPEDDAQ